MTMGQDTIGDTLPYYVGAGVEQFVPETRQVAFGQYDFFPTDSNRLFFRFDEASVLATQSVSDGVAGGALPFSPWIHSVFFLLFLFSFLLFAFIFRWEGSALKSNFKSIFSPGKPITSTHKSQVTKTEAWGEFYLLLQTILIFSILLFSWLWERGFFPFSTDGQTLGFAVIFVCFSLLVYLKISAYRLIGTFFLKNEIKNWITFYSRMMEMLGIVIFLPAVFYVYLQEIRNIILIGILVLFFISRLVIYIELLNIFVKNKVSPFYFFVYLCGIEIAPYLLLYKGVLFALTIAGDNII